MTQDALSDLLRSVRLRGALYFHVDCTEPWVTEVPHSSAMAPAIMPESEHMMDYHVVIHGTCWATVAGEASVQLHAGDVIVLPHGDAHVLSSVPGMRAKPDIDFLYQSRPPQLPFMLHQGMERRTAGAPADAQSIQTSLLCGFLGCDRRPFNPLLESLPRMIHAPASELAGDGDDWIAHFARLAAAESERKRPGGEVVLERMSVSVTDWILPDAAAPAAAQAIRMPTPSERIGAVLVLDSWAISFFWSCESTPSIDFAFIRDIQYSVGWFRRPGNSAARRTKYREKVPLAE